MPNKLQKFAEFKEFQNCSHLPFEEIQNGHPLKGLWHTDFFNNNNPIVLELGCGRGEYTIGLAKNNPDKNFIGVDIKGNRIWTGAKYANENKLNNVAFILSNCTICRTPAQINDFKFQLGTTLPFTNTNFKNNINLIASFEFERPLAKRKPN